MAGRAASGSSGAAPAPPVTGDERVRRAVVGGRRSRLGGQLGRDPEREHLAELDAPLVERIDPPDRALGEHLVLIEGNERAEGPRIEALREDRVRRVIASERAVWDLRF